MFETAFFGERLENAISSESARSDLQRYEPAIVALLQGRAEANEQALMDEESRKAVGARRGIPDAMESARDLVRTAAHYAIADKRTVLTLADVEAAYKARYCDYWPFCR